MGESRAAVTDRLYRDHRGWLQGWLRGRLACPHDAADLTHDTFLRVLTGRDLQVLREPRAYLLVVASRLLSNRFKRKRLEREVLEQVRAILMREDERTPEVVHIARDLLARLLDLLVEELPDKPRRAFIMARVDGLTYREIAARLEVSESSVKQYLMRALAHCHARLYTEHDS